VEELGQSLQQGSILSHINRLNIFLSIASQLHYLHFFNSIGKWKNVVASRTIIDWMH